MNKFTLLYSFFCLLQIPLFAQTVSFLPKNCEHTVEMIDNQWGKKDLIALKNFISNQLLNEQHSPISLPFSPLIHSENDGERGAIDPLSDKFLNLKAIRAYRSQQYGLAFQLYYQLIQSFPDSPFLKESYLFAALSLELEEKKKQDNEKENRSLSLAREFKKKLFTEYPDSIYAAEAYFLYYSIQDYLEGEKAAIQHLMKFESLFPKSPYLIKVYYLLGMDCKRNRKTIEGKWIRKRNLNATVRYFQSLESKFQEFYKLGLLNDSFKDYLQMVYTAKIELGLTYLKIAEESQKVKSDIYLEYAKKVFLEIVSDFVEEGKESKNSFLKESAGNLIKQEPYPRYLEESSYLLGLTYMKSNQENEAKKKFLQMLKAYESLKITKGLFLSKTLRDLAILAAKGNDHREAINYFKRAEDSAKGKILTTEQKLDLWIQLSLSYLELKEFDQAILILSKVINDDSISHLRVKAMYLRSEVYEASGRIDLAKKQLEATAKKGGDWSLKAQNKLKFLNN